MWSETLDSTIHDPDFCLGVAKSLSEWPFSARELVPMTEFWDKLACVKVFLESLQLFLSEGVALGIEHWSLVEVAAAVPRLCLGLQFRGFPWRSRHLPFVCPIFRQCSHLGFFFFFFALVGTWTPTNNQCWSVTGWWIKHHFSPIFFTTSEKTDRWEGSCPQDTTTSFIKTFMQSQEEFKWSLFFENHFVLAASLVQSQSQLKRIKLLPSRSGNVEILSYRKISLT